MRSSELWKAQDRSRTNRTRSTRSGRLQGRARLCSFLFGFFLLLQSTLPAEVVNIQIDPTLNPIQTPSGGIVPDGTALFVVSYKTTQDAFFTALRGATTASDLVTVFSSQLKFFNPDPFVKPDYGTYGNPEIGWTSEGGAAAEISPTTTSNLPIFVLFSSNINPFDPTGNFLLVKGRGTNDDSYIPKLGEAPSNIEMSGNSTLGSDVIYGQFFSSTGAFQMAAAGAYGQIFNTNESAVAGTPFSRQVLNNFGANQFSAPSLPGGLSIDASTGLISGTFGGGTFTISATNTLTGKTATKTLTYSLISLKPSVTGITPNNATFGASANITINIDNGATNVTVAGLPAGLQHRGGTSTSILGTPTVAGTFALAITASNSSGNDRQTFSLTVLPGAAPVIYGENEIPATQFREYLNSTDTSKHIYKFVTDLDEDPIRKPNSYTLPANAKTALNSIGVYLDEQTGVLYGTPTARTDLQLPITIANAAISATKNFTLSVKYEAPELAMPGKQSVNEFVVGKPVKLPLIFSRQSVVSEIDGTGFAGQFPGLVLNVNQFNNATITGTPTQVKSAGTLIKLKNADQTKDLVSTLNLTIVADRGQPSVNGEVEYVFSVGTRVSVQLTADNGGANFAIVEGELPTGISLTSGGLLSGVPTKAGTYAPRIRASNRVGPGPGRLFRMVVTEDPPTIISSSVALGTVSSPFSFALTAAPNPTAFQISSGTLPEGLSLSADTGVIAGTPKVSGTFVVGVQARNSNRLGPVSTLTLSIAGRPPVITSPLVASGNANLAFRYEIKASNVPTSFSALGLPRGLTIDPQTGVISGTAESVFDGSITITAANATGTNTATLQLKINPEVVIISSKQVNGTVGTPLSFQLTSNPSSDVIFSEGTQKLPNGIEISPQGLITGTPLASISSQITIQAERRGQITQDSRFTSVSFSFANPSFVASTAQEGVLTFQAGIPGTASISSPPNFTIQSVTLENVPEGLSWNGSALSGTAKTATRIDVVSKINLKAILTTPKGIATISKSYQIRVSGTPASLNLSPSLEIEVGKETKIPLPYEGTDVQFTYSGLPTGISILNGVLTGTNKSTNGPSYWKALITADNSSVAGGTSVTREVSIWLRNPVPVMTNRLKIMAAQGRGGSLNLAFDALSVDKIRPVSLPEGVTLVDNKLTVAPSIPAGTYRATIQSENQERPGDPASVLQTATGDIRIFIDAISPAAVAAAVPTAVPAVANKPISVQLVPADAGVRISGFGLPPGLSIDSEAGTLSGTPAQSGKYTATIFVQNGKRWIKKKVSFVVR